MKKLLPILLCYLLMTTQVYAISGGPVFGQGGINPVGVYSGVITVTRIRDFINDPTTGAPVVDPTTGQDAFKVDAATVSLGLFSLGVPTTSVATGAFIQFVNGDVFVGSIVASVDPDSGVLSGIVEGTSSFSTSFTNTAGSTTTTSTLLVENRAAGKISAHISGTRSGQSSATIVGTATLIVNSGGDRQLSPDGFNNGPLVQNYGLDCVVTGFRQSTVYASVNSLGLNTAGL